VAGMSLGPKRRQRVVALQRELEKLGAADLLAICSKNNQEDALAALERHPTWSAVVALLLPANQLESKSDQHREIGG